MGAIRQETVRPPLRERRVGKQRGGQRLQQQRYTQLAQHVLLGRIVEIDLHGTRARHHIEATRADLRHVAPHDRVARLRHPRHLLARRDRVKSERQEADLQIARHAAHLFVVRLELGHGVVQRFQRRARKFELASGFQRNRRVALLQADEVAGVGDRRAGKALKALEQLADRARLAVRRLVRRGSEITDAEAEFFVLGADAEAFHWLASGGDMIGQLLHRGDRRRVGVSGIGHTAPRRVGSRYAISGSPPPATMPGPRCRPYQHEGCAARAIQALQRDARAALQAPPV